MLSAVEDQRAVFPAATASQADGALRFTNSDMLDGVSASVINANQLNDIARLYYETIRPNGIDNEVFINGNPKIGDVYGIFSVKLQFELGSPSFVRRSRSFSTRRARGKVWTSDSY